ncbi:putative glutathione S-transferase [Xylaria sp. CBS 124048]|nr:putative glutathione S-transferase [Xylaria sp. CBS 124048]
MPAPNLHPIATGLARQTVDNHSAKQQLKLYGSWFDPFSQRAWLTLEEKGIPYEYIEVNPYNKSPEFLRVNPRGLMPTLEVSPGKPLYESGVVCDYLEYQYAEHKPNLLPSDAYDRARSRIWIEYVTTKIIPAYHRLLQFQPASYEGNGAARIEEMRAELRKYLLEFTAQMVDASQGPFFTGKQVGLVDIMLIPWALRLWVFEEFKGGPAVPEKGKGGEEWERWHVWLTAVNELGSVKRTMSDRVHYSAVIEPYANDTAQSELAKATRAGRGVP